MEFGIFSNGFRPHTTASQTYEEDISEIVLADQLGFATPISAAARRTRLYHKVNTLPVPELLM